MTESEPVRLAHDPDSPRELRWALSELSDEVPSDEALGALRLRLTPLVGEPARLKREVSRLGTSLRHLDATEPSAEQLTALRAALPRSPTRNRPENKPRRALARATRAAWLWPLAAAAAAGAAYFFYERAQTHQPEPVPAHGPLAPSGAPLAPPSGPESSTEPVASAAAAAPSSTLPALSAAPAAAKPSELTLLREAQKALRTEPSKALSLANQHARLYPGGLLAQEREVVAISALESLGRAAEARARAARFQAAYPGSAYWPRIQHLIASDAP